jgi:hypothetical protein
MNFFDIKLIFTQLKYKTFRNFVKSKKRSIDRELVIKRIQKCEKELERLKKILIEDDNFKIV